MFLPAFSPHRLPPPHFRLWTNWPICT